MMLSMSFEEVRLLRYSKAVARLSLMLIFSIL